MAAPGDEGRLRVVIAGEIILWHSNGKAEGLVALIFAPQRVRVVFRMARQENLPSAAVKIA